MTIQNFRFLKSIFRVRVRRKRPEQKPKFSTHRPDGTRRARPELQINVERRWSDWKPMLVYAASKAEAKATVTQRLLDSGTPASDFEIHPAIECKPFAEAKSAFATAAGSILVSLAKDDWFALLGDLMREHHTAEPVKSEPPKSHDLLYFEEATKQEDLARFLEVKEQVDAEFSGEDDSPEDDGFDATELLAEIQREFPKCNARILRGMAGDGRIPPRRKPYSQKHLEAALDYFRKWGVQRRRRRTKASA